MTTLNEALDRIWQDKAPRRLSAAAALSDMDEDAILKMLAHLLVAEAGEWLKVDSFEPHAFLLRYRGGTVPSRAHLGICPVQNTIIHLVDINRALYVDDEGFAKIWGQPREYSAESILAAQQFARDHFASLLYLPSTMRQQQLDEVSASLGVSKELLVKFALDHKC